VFSVLFFECKLFLVPLAQKQGVGLGLLTSEGNSAELPIHYHDNGGKRQLLTLARSSTLP